MKQKLLSKLKGASWYTVALILIFILAGLEAYIGLELFSLMELLGASTFVIAYFAMMMVFLERVGRKFSKVFMFIAIIAALPFAFELVLFVEVAGIEVAYSCLLIMLTPFTNWFVNIIERIKVFLSNFISLIQNHQILKTKIYLSHAVMCTFIFALTSSLFFSSIIWVPILMFGDKII